MMNEQPISLPAIRIGVLEDDLNFSDYLSAVIRAEAGMELAFCLSTVAGAKTALSSENVDVLRSELPGNAAGSRSQVTFE